MYSEWYLHKIKLTELCTGSDIWKQCKVEEKKGQPCNNIPKEAPNLIEEDLETWTTSRLLGWIKTDVTWHGESADHRRCLRSSHVEEKHHLADKWSRQLIKVSKNEPVVRFKTRVNYSLTNYNLNGWLVRYQHRIHMLYTSLLQACRWMWFVCWLKETMSDKAVSHLTVRQDSVASTAEQLVLLS